jgi:hypothetical protein
VEVEQEFVANPLQDSMDNGDNLVYQFKAGPSSVMMKDLAIVASSPPDDATVTW